jgi:hypothetical protein
MPKSEAVQQLDRWITLAYEHLERTKEMPVVIGVELYEHFDETCKVIEATEYEVVIESRFASRTRIRREELELRPKPRD